MENPPQYPAEPPGAAEGPVYGSRGGYGAGAPPGPVPPTPPPPWPVQHGQYNQHNQRPPPFPHPPAFDPSRPPPGFFGEQQTGPWPPPTTRGQQPHVMTDQGGTFTHFGPPPQMPSPSLPPPVHQPRFLPPVNPSFTPDYHQPPSSTMPHQYNQSPEGSWPGDGQNNGNTTMPVHQQRFPPINPNFTPDYHQPPSSSTLSHQYIQTPESPWPVGGQNKGNTPLTTMPVHQQRFLPPINPSFTPDYHQPPSSPMPHHYNQTPEIPWPGGGQNKGNTTIPVASDEDAKQRKQDEQWVKGFLQRRRSKPADAAAVEAAISQPPSKQSVSDFRQQLYSTVRMLSELTQLCQALKTNLENQAVWTEAHSRAVELKSSLQERLVGLQDREVISRVKKNLEMIQKKRARLRRRKAERMEEKLEEERRASEREAAIDKFQMKQIQELEEKNRERELKLAADSVLSEVRKKQADSKRMVDILKALEKLRKLRKEAASRKGMFPEKECDEVFEGHLTRLRSLIKKRTAVYGAEEKALMVMLEGEQEEERKRDREKRLKREREKLLLKKKEIDTMLFGAELPPDHPLQPFQEYYTQAERSLPVLIQIRREWDQFLVPVDHPDGTTIPPGWVLPDPPADDVWATALET